MSLPLPERLREAATDPVWFHTRAERLLEAADALATLQAEKDALRAALTGPVIKPEIITALRDWAEFEQDGGNVKQGAAINIILDWYERALAASRHPKEPT